MAHETFGHVAYGVNPQTAFVQRPDPYEIGRWEGEGGATAGGGPAPEYICPMHPEVRQTEPGACHKCGMALEPKYTDSC
jgi:Cu+-exporting ATPase